MITVNKSGHFLKAPLAVLIVAVAIFAPLSISAQGITTQNDVKNIIERIGDFVIFIGSALVVIMLVLAGISYLTAGGNDQKIAQAKSNLKWVLVGAVVIIGVGVILSTIENIVSTGQL